MKAHQTVPRTLMMQNATHLRRVSSLGSRTHYYLPRIVRFQEFQHLYVCCVAGNFATLYPLRVDVYVTKCIMLLLTSVYARGQTQGNPNPMLRSLT